MSPVQLTSSSKTSQEKGVPIRAAAPLIAEIVASIEKECTGPENGRVCPQSWVEKYELTGLTPMPEWPKMFTKPTPWIAVGDHGFAAGDYIDFIVYNLFFRSPRKLGGTFADVGSSNGVHGDNTLFFAKEMGWKGLLVEGSACAACILPKNRMESTIVRRGIGKKEGTWRFDLNLQRTFCTELVKVPECAQQQQELSQTVCVSNVSTIFREHNVKHVDFMSLDVELSTFDAVASIPFEQVTVHVLVAECSNDCLQLLKSKGYQTVGLNDRDVLAWRPERFPDLKGT